MGGKRMTRRGWRMRRRRQRGRMQLTICKMPGVLSVLLRRPPPGSLPGLLPGALVGPLPR